MTKFSDLNLAPKVLKAVVEAGYESPTPIQAGAIPPALEGRDVLGIAQTGTGKTYTMEGNRSVNSSVPWEKVSRVDFRLELLQV